MKKSKPTISSNTTSMPGGGTKTIEVDSEGTTITYSGVNNLHLGRTITVSSSAMFQPTSSKASTCQSSSPSWQASPQPKPGQSYSGTVTSSTGSKVVIHNSTGVTIGNKTLFNALNKQSSQNSKCQDAKENKYDKSDTKSQCSLS